VKSRGKCERPFAVGKERVKTLEWLEAIRLLNSVRTSQETRHVSATKPNRLMLFRETVAVFCENQTEHTDTLCGQNAQFNNVIAGGTYSYHSA
jgi:hypothetical protein